MNNPVIFVGFLIFLQISCGMNFLSEKNVYHGDLATRNILLTETLVAKISDFGLSRRLYDKIFTVYTEDEKDLKLPMKWLALETLQHRKTSVKSDIWSYGVVIWEMFEFGAEPYGSRKLMYIVSATHI